MRQCKLDNLLFLFVILSAASPFSTASQNTLRLGTGHYPPYVFVDDIGSVAKRGESTEIVIEAAEIAGFNTEFEVISLPWKRAEQHLKEEKVIALYPYAHTPKRAEIYAYSDPIGSAKVVFFYLKDNKKIVNNSYSFSELIGFEHGGVIGYFYEEYPEIIALEMEYVVSDFQNIKKLYSSRIDFLIADERAGWHYINTLYPKESNRFATLKAPFYQQDIHLIFLKKNSSHSEFLKKFNAGISLLKKNGDYQKIRIKYEPATDHSPDQ